MSEDKRDYGDCGECVTRRDFVRSAAGVLAGASLGGLGACAPGAGASAARASVAGVTSVERADVARARGPAPEELVKRFYATLSEPQRALICLDWDDARRTKVSQNWQIVDQEIGAFYTPDQQEALRRIFEGLVTPDGYERFMRAFRDDAGGFARYSVALFGDPDTSKYEWVMTGRHLTLRCNGGSEEAFGGPVFYGHAVGKVVGGDEDPDHPGNVWWRQALLANKVYSTFDGKQRAQALLARSPGDDPSSVRLRAAGEREGVPVGELSRDQRALVEDVMRDLLAPYRAADVERVMRSIKRNGGLEQVRLAFYREEDLGADGVWDRWMLQGPTVSWFFRGSPHVHSWVRVAE